MKPHLKAKLKRLKIDMNGLNDTPGKKLLTRPGVKPSEVQALDVLLTTVNNPDVAQDVEPGVRSDPTAAFQALPPGQPEMPSVVAPIRNPIASTAADLGLHVSPGPGNPGATGTNGTAGIVQAPDNKRLYFTGRLKVGKDTTAAAAGCKILGFADPMYAIAGFFFRREFSSTVSKDLAGARAFLQAVGQIGRGVISEAYPLTPARALLEREIRKAGTDGEICREAGVDWQSFGSNNNIWLDSAIRRVDSYLLENPDARVAITSVRFEFERVALKAAGWSGWHCYCSPQAWATRLAKSKLTPQSPAVNDLSEKLAAELDAGLTKELSARRVGNKLRVIWTDDAAPCPSNRLHTVESFLQLLQVQPPAPAIAPDDNF